jgi:hypothetical protein
MARSWPEVNIHESVRSFVLRERLRQAGGSERTMSILRAVVWRQG